MDLKLAGIFFFYIYDDNVKMASHCLYKVVFDAGWEN